MNAKQGTNDAEDAEDAATRLVRATLGYADDNLNAAQRLLSSQRGHPSSFTGSKPSLTETWKRLEESSDPALVQEVQTLYAQLVAHLDGDDQRLADHLVEVIVAQREQQQQDNGDSHRNLGHNNPTTNEQTASFKLTLIAEETSLIRECLYMLQGINGERLKLIKEKFGMRSAALDTPIPPLQLRHSRLGSGARDALCLTHEAGWLYTRIQSFIAQHTTSRGGGGSVIARALAGAFDRELQSYRSFLAQLEYQVDQNLSFGIRQLLVELKPAIRRLQTLAMLADGLTKDSLSSNKKGNGGQGHLILTSLYMHSRHGDSRHASLVHSLLQQASRPWFDMLYEWTTQGLLHDPAQEFFVVELQQDVKNTQNPTNLWLDRYRLETSKVPVGILETELIEPVFLIGKGINYIRRCLLDEAWSMQELLLQQDDEENDHDPSIENLEGRKKRLGFYYHASPPLSPVANGTSLTFRRTIDKAADLVHSHILESLRQDHFFLEHLFALKQFLLLGQGDFFSALMDGLHTEFGDRRGIVGIYRHSLASVAETALRSTNANNFPPYVLERLQVELLLDANDDARFMFAENKDSDGSTRSGSDDRTFWDIFALDYTIPDPLIAIVHPTAMERYKQLFSSLFGLKKVEFMLNLTWRQSAILQHALQTSAQYNAINVMTSAAYARATVLLRQISIIRQSMMHFVVNLKSYLMFEVLESGWKHLVRKIEDAKTLDEVIQAHDNYLNGICRKSLFRSNVESSSDVDLSKRVKELLRLSNEFCKHQQKLFGNALQAADRAAEKRRQAEERLTQGDWGFRSQKEVSEEESFFGLADSSKLQELDRFSAVFNECIDGLLKALDRKLHGGPALPPPKLDTPTSTPPLHYDTLNEASLDDQDDLDSLRFLSFQLKGN